MRSILAFLFVASMFGQSTTFGQATLFGPQTQLGPGSAPGPKTVVQCVKSSTTVALTSTVVGNWVFAGMLASSGSTTGFTDGGDTFAADASNGTSGSALTYATRAKILTGGTITVDSHCSGCSGFEMFACEVNGISGTTYDNTTGATFTTPGATPFSINTITTNFANEFVLELLVSTGSSNALGAGAGWTVITTTSSTVQLAAYKIVSSGTSQSDAYTYNTTPPTSGHAQVSASQ